MTDTEQRFLLGATFEDVDVPGLIRESDGTVWLINPDHTRTRLTGTGGVAEKTAELEVTDPAGAALTTGDGQAFLIIPAVLNGLNLVTAAAALITVSSSGTPTVQIRNVTQSADMLSTRITIDANEKTSYTAAAQPVIDAAHDGVATGDQLAVDVDVAGTGAKGLFVILGFA